MNELLPRLGDIVLYHDPDTARMLPAIVSEEPTQALGKVHATLTVFSRHGADVKHNVPNAPGEFGHWSFRPGD
jgi:hypothetical protein